MKTTIKIIVGIIAIILVINIVDRLLIHNGSTIGRDTYKEFNNRFYVLRSNSQKSLLDGEYLYGANRVSQILMHDIEKYIQINDKVYLIGYYSSVAVADSSRSSYYSYNPKTRQEVVFQSKADIPRYIILEYTKGDIKLYSKLEDIPLEDKGIFERPLDQDCLVNRSCYEKGLIIDDSP